MKNFDLMPCDEPQFAKVRIASGENLKVGNVAITEETQAEFGIANSVQTLPTKHPLGPLVR